ncbi:MAG TPA: hypothetical protein VMB18_15455 [Terriglobales bacterium]|nr:hypothetical protein [Terriglobales bacterium]
MSTSKLTPGHVRILAICLLLALPFICVAQREPVKQQQKSPTAAPEEDKTTTTAESDEHEDPQFKAMKYRLIGPFRGGRSLTAAGVAGDPTIYYFGATGGGVWKSSDAGMTWNPVFDKESASSIGSLAIAASDPNVVYVGTGEGCIRGNTAQGDGVYKTVDGGKTWKNVGLQDSRAIGRVIVDPKDANIVFVAALGHPFGPNAERGIFRTTDGGKTWQRVLYKDENSGGIDVAFDPHNSHILYATLWQARRTPWDLTSGGPGSGLYRSNDGGSTWKLLTEHGLPKGPYGRIGVAVAANSDRVYALIEAQDGGLYRSDDGGDTWQLVNNSRSLWQRAWYYMHVTADPQDSDEVYIANVDFYRSSDGGRSFNKVKAPHGDNHSVWIDPRNNKRMIVANDGGVTISVDGGKTWSREDNQPTGQFYHVITDSRTPYYVYGSQQDSGSVAIASRSDNGFIDVSDWYSVGGGEAGYIAPYPPDPNIVYAGEYQGTITRFDKRDGEVKNIGEQPEISDGGGAAILEHRFQWTAPILISPHDPKVVYHGGERLFRTTDGGMHWEAISPDLTRNDKSKQQVSGGPIDKDDSGTEYYDTIFAIAESPITRGLIWVGTDDGLVQITRDDGKNWTNVTPKDLPEFSRISQIDASPHEAGTAYVAVDRHQNDDLSPWIYKTDDYGKTWTKCVHGIPNGSFARSVREDPVKRGLLYAGTETGVYVSFDDGANWRSLQLNLPTTPVHDLVVKGNDLVLATHGRAFWILDDISPLRQYTTEIPDQQLHLYKPGVALRYQNSSDEPSKPVLVGLNPPPGAIIYYWLKDKPKGEVTIEIVDSRGQLVRKYSSNQIQPLDEPADPEDKKPEKQIKPEQGMNALLWDLRYEPAHYVPDYYLWEYKDGSKGPLAMPGTYEVRITADGKTETAPLEIKLDPRVQVSRAELQEQFDLLIQIRDQLSRVYDSINQIQDVRAQVEGMEKRLPNNDSTKPLLAAAAGLDVHLLDVRDQMIQVRNTANEDSLAYPQRVDDKLAGLAMAVGGDTDSAPTEAEYRIFAKLKKQSEDGIARWQELQQTELASLQKMTAAQNIQAIVVPAGDNASSAVGARK